MDEKPTTAEERADLRLKWSSVPHSPEFRLINDYDRLRESLVLVEPISSARHTLDLIADRVSGGLLDEREVKRTLDLCDELGRQIRNMEAAYEETLLRAGKTTAAQHEALTLAKRALDEAECKCPDSTIRVGSDPWCFKHQALHAITKLEEGEG